MSMEKEVLEQPEFDPARLQWARVKCRNSECGDEFVCTPFSDYFGSNGVTNDDGVFTDGQCEPCMLTDLSMQRVDNPIQLTDSAGIIGKPIKPHPLD